MEAVFARSWFRVRNRWQPFAVRRLACAIGIRRGSVFLMDRQGLFSLALCANRSFSSSTCRFAAQAQCFGRLCVLVAVPLGFSVVALRCPPWQARHSVCAGAAFDCPVSQSARSGGPETCQNWSKSFWRHSPVLVLDACQSWISWQFQHFG